MRPLLTIVIAFMMLATLLSCRRGENEKPETTRERADVVTLSSAALREMHFEITRVQAVPFHAMLVVPAKVITNQNNEALVGSLVQGRVSRLHAKAGDHVSAGQILMTVDGLEIGSIKAAYLKAKANLDYAEADLRRHKSLNDQNVGSKQSFLEAQAEHEKARAEFNAEDKKIHAIGLTDDDVLKSNGNDHSAGTLPIRSPISGVIVERSVVLGQLVDATTNAFRIVNTATVWVDGRMPEKDANAVMEKSSVQFTTSSNPNEVFTGNIQYIGAVLDEQTRSLTVRAEFVNKSGALKPLMFGELRIPSGAGHTAILLPAEAIMRDGGKQYVFVQRNDSTFEKRPVTTGANQDALIEITAGLSEGDPVVVKGAFYIKSDLKKEELGE
jgi:membrane fusion protein, heavy metal efflux system